MSVASWYGSDPRFLLGAMLPDFLSMLACARPHLVDSELARGVALHHATDAAFHDIPEFLELVTGARTALAARGLGRGAARAVAHIGIELLLDEVLMEGEVGRRSYWRALDCARDVNLPIEWQRAEDAERFGSLIAALHERGLPTEPPAPHAVAARLRRAVAARPRLAFPASLEDAVADWVVQARRAVVGWEPAIMTELRSRLDGAGFG